jgi:hypothetical protein
MWNYNYNPKIKKNNDNNNKICYPFINFTELKFQYSQRKPQEIEICTLGVLKNKNVNPPFNLLHYDCSVGIPHQQKNDNSSSEMHTRFALIIFSKIGNRNR